MKKLVVIPHERYKQLLSKEMPKNSTENVTESSKPTQISQSQDKTEDHLTPIDKIPVEKDSGVEKSVSTDNTKDNLIPPPPGEPILY